MKLTKAASEVCDRISFINMWTMSSMDDHQRVSRTLPGSENDEYDSAATKLVGEAVLCKVVDLYQVYNRRVLKLVIDAAPDVLGDFRFRIPLEATELSAMIKGTASPSTLLDRIQFNDRTVRESIHNHLKIWKESEMDFLIEARNCLVHADGYGFSSDLRTKVQPGASPWKLPFSFSPDHRLEVDESTAMTVCTIALAQISIMDQMLVSLYGLDAEERVPRTFSRKMKG
jgi:hypothetical protein